MPLETATYISDLNASNPIGATDPLSSADDHLRLLKATIRATFPSVAGAVTPTHTAINQTCVGTGGTFPAINGSALTNLSAANVTGANALPDSVLSTNVPRLNASNTFTGTTQTITGTAARLVISDTSGQNSVVAFQKAGAAKAYIGVSNAAGNLVSGAADGDIGVLAATSGGFAFSGNGGSTMHFGLSAAGVLTTPNASASEVGYKGVPANSKSGNYTLVLSDAAQLFYQNTVSSTFTIPANASVAFPVGTAVTFINAGTGGTISIAITTDTMRLGGAGTTGTRTLADWGVATAIKIASTTWVISGVGLS